MHAAQRSECPACGEVFVARAATAQSLTESGTCGRWRSAQPSLIRTATQREFDIEDDMASCRRGTLFLSHAVRLLDGGGHSGKSTQHQRRSHAQGKGTQLDRRDRAMTKTASDAVRTTYSNKNFQAPFGNARDAPPVGDVGTWMALYQLKSRL